MRILLLVVVVGLAGCATTPHSGVSNDGLAPTLANGPAQRSSGQRVEKRGLPLTPGQKIALWTGVAVLLAYLMGESDDDDTSAFVGP